MDKYCNDIRQLSHWCMDAVAEHQYKYVACNVCACYDKTVSW